MPLTTFQAILKWIGETDLQDNRHANKIRDVNVLLIHWRPFISTHKHCGSQQLTGLVPATDSKLGISHFER
jgi:hypothetical protein